MHAFIYYNLVLFLNNVKSLTMLNKVHQVFSSTVKSHETNYGQLTRWKVLKLCPLGLHKLLAKAIKWVFLVQNENQSDIVLPPLLTYECKMWKDSPTLYKVSWFKSSSNSFPCHGSFSINSFIWLHFSLTYCS